MAGNKYVNDYRPVESVSVSGTVSVALSRNRGDRRQRHKSRSAAESGGGDRQYCSANALAESGGGVSVAGRAAGDFGESGDSGGPGEHRS